MEVPKRDIHNVIHRLTQGDADEQKRVLETFFTPDVSFEHPFCRVSSFSNRTLPVLGEVSSRWVLWMIYRWYKWLSPTIEYRIHSVAYDATLMWLYVNMSQTFSLWFNPFFKSPMTLVVVLKLQQNPATNRFHIHAQEDHIPPREAVKLFIPKGDQMVDMLHSLVSATMPPAPHTTSIPQVPVTEERKPFEFSTGALPYFPSNKDANGVFTDDDANKTLWNLGMARATGAETPTHPEGTTTSTSPTTTSSSSPTGTTQDNWAAQHRDQTVLQQHCEFFDRDRDGIVWPLDTLVAFRQLGYHWVWCVMSVWLIHGFLSYATHPGWIPDPFFRIHLARIHKNKHGSDSATYDPEGRFVPQHFEDIFAKYSTVPDRQGLYWRDVGAMLRGQRVVADPFGWGASFFEWFATYLLLWPEDGIMRKEDIRRIYDGSIFFELAERRSKGADHHHETHPRKAEKSD
ncbi:hypothetical protein DFQ27_009079 [Actinomortierella ambigua]|uniref:SigF-like NTF2-like domain-containing protein n=1 Tax=Actinomortierella ambigua TaxID=1343610 RepID=A0A9P6UD55_9FUNG|nr:hypothetical protein DFQ27_009079 [Actinomortierella ambigua]